MAEVLVLGVSHKTAPLELRERLALTEGRAVGVLGELVTSGQTSEAAAISTCNRTELYMFASDPVNAESQALGLLARLAAALQCCPSELAPQPQPQSPPQPRRDPPPTAPDAPAERRE